ncbi:unnamed protein product, partial [Amoebophrya sp. A120]|eukprot:GSA120T00005297001.1
MSEEAKKWRAKDPLNRTEIAAKLRDKDCVNVVRRSGRLKRFVPERVWRQIYTYANSNAETYHKMDGHTIHFAGSSLPSMPRVPEANKSGELTDRHPIDVAVSVAATSVNLSSNTDALSFDILLDSTIQICNRLCAPLVVSAQGARFSEDHTQLEKQHRSSQMRNRSLLIAEAASSPDDRSFNEQTPADDATAYDARRPGSPGMHTTLRKMATASRASGEVLQRQHTLPPGANAELKHSPFLLTFAFNQGTETFKTQYPLVLDYHMRSAEKPHRLHFRNREPDVLAPGDVAELRRTDSERAAGKKSWAACCSRRTGPRTLDNEDDPFAASSRDDSTSISVLYTCDNAPERQLPNQIASDVFFWPSPIMQVSVYASYWVVNRRSDLDFFVAHGTPQLDSNRPAYQVRANTRMILSEDHIQRKGLLSEVREIQVGVTNQFMRGLDLGPAGGGKSYIPSAQNPGRHSLLSNASATSNKAQLKRQVTARAISGAASTEKAPLYMMSHPFPVKQVTTGGMVVVPKTMYNPIQRVFGYSVNTAPFPFYRTLVIEMVRAVTLVNHKRHPIWVRSKGEAGYQKVDPHQQAQWDPQSDALMKEIQYARSRGKPMDEKKILEHVQLRITGDTDKHYSSSFSILEHECFQLSTAISEEDLPLASMRIITRRGELQRRERSKQLRRRNSNGRSRFGLNIN